MGRLQFDFHTGAKHKSWDRVAAFYAKAAQFRSCRKFREAETEALREAFETCGDKRERKRPRRRVGF